MAGRRPAIPNPLAVAFGGALRIARGSWTTQTVTERVGIADSFYRLIESGRNHPSISKAPAIWRAFEGRVQFEAISMFLATIAASEDKKLIAGTPSRRGEYMHANVDLVCDILTDSHPFKSFLRRFVSPPRNLPLKLLQKRDLKCSVLELVDREYVNIREVVQVSGLTEDASRLLCNFADYSTAARIVEGTYAQKFFGPIPSNYKRMFDGLRESVERLPRTFAPGVSWEWEGLNQAAFRELDAICYADPLLSTENLRNYQFAYLWDREFRTATFHILNGGGDAAALKSTFWTNLKSVLAADPRTKRLAQEVESVSRKTIFRPCDDATSEALLALLQDIHANEVRSVSPNAMWFFRTEDDALVGAASFIDASTKTSEWIRFLTFNECSFVLSRINNLMEMH